MRDETLIGIFAAVVFVLLTAALYAWDKHSCYYRANQMGFKSSYTLVGGCMIEYKPNKWIDIDKYRAVDE